MIIQTKVFGEITIDEEKIITFPKGIVGFPDLTEFTMIHDEETGAGSIHWLQSIQEPAFAMPVMDPLLIKEDYNPEVEEEWIKPLGELNPEELLVLVTVTVPGDLTKMSVNLRGPIVINAGAKKACQVIIEGDEYQVKYPIYDILQAKKAGE
ncbi:flagellar assembly protein FliW [Kineothrix sp. MB12-C1]|uniref:flagellar assembly protein FliW n=1 Tax=Kineothrix sp. MB12-C1 TaxID=3070215 RepID=UPI0027D26D84|nr:flagellar assembly protein FliW [Kineothrix sp. MB12-C1]WMC93891.1 flagellar assembly protein FliW [Kineothrix sp. MB12-C1]